MKMVSAAKLKKAQDAILQMRPYAFRLNRILARLGAAVDVNEGNPFAEQRAPDRVLIVLISANRGLCGGFNSNVARGVIDLVENTYKPQWEAGRVDLLLIGKKGGEILKGKGYPRFPSLNDLLEKPSYDPVGKVAEDLMQQFLIHKYDRIDLIYNQFKNAATQVMTHEQFLPIEIQSAAPEEGPEPYYIFEPSLTYMVEVLIPQALKVQFYKAVLDSLAAEHGARMTAMHQATDNATQLIRELNLEYNKARQAAITGELIEIIGGAEVLRS